MAEEVKEIVLVQSNDFLKLCDEFSKRYAVLSDGIYTSGDGKFKINKLQIRDSRTGKSIATPTRVHNTSGITQINNDLKLKQSTILFFLVWGFLKFQNLNKSDVDVDKEAIVICKRNYSFFYSDFLPEAIEILNVNASGNLSRIKFLSTEGKKI